ncbi:nucleic acid-binding, OB-fold protein, partial [Tanacetum coccineum]
AIRFTTEATIKNINTKREWFYESCHQCSRTAVKQGDNYTCLDHGPQPGPFFRYKFKSYITDASGTTSLTFFTPAADKITGHSCEELVKKYKPANPKKIPPEVLTTKGKTSIFQFHYNTFAHVTEFTLDDVFSINTSGDGTSSVAETKHKEPSVTTLPGTTHLTTDKEYFEEEEETSTSKEVNKETKKPKGD